MSAEPYVKRNPGDLITAEDWNKVQGLIKDDIGSQIESAIDGITLVPEAENAKKLENKTADELAKEILDKVFQTLPTRTGYKRLFKRIPADKKPNVIKHELGAMPLVDLYQLDRFDAVCSEDGEKSQGSVLFYLYHSSEKRITFTQPNPTPPPVSTKITVDNEPTDGTPAFRIPFRDMLALYNVRYNDNSSLDNLETEFWEAFFAAPNDEFLDDDYCRSPWFDKCCGDQRTVGELKQKGEWDDIWFKVVPYKTVNHTTPEELENRKVPAPASVPDAGTAPIGVEVLHYDHNTLGIRTLGNEEIPVMALLKV
ncbi:MAG: hypothetical protein ACREAM_02925 [Blastocatellia bacterium]